MPKIRTVAKDPAKVAAGKARAAASIRDSSGKFVSRILYNEIVKVTAAVKGIDTSKVNATQTEKITSIMSDAKISAKDVKDFYEKQPEVFEQIINAGEITGTGKNSNQIEKAISDFSGTVILNGKEVTEAQAKKGLIDFKQYLSTNINVVDFVIKPTMTFDGKMKLNIPDKKDLMKQLKEYFGVNTIEELEDFSGAEISEALNDILGDDSDITIYAS